MIDKFNELPWHDAELVQVVIDRRRDLVQVVVCWPEDDDSIFTYIEFINCYGFCGDMYFDVLPPDSILSAECVQNAPALDRLKQTWSKIGADFSEVKCYRIVTNSTASQIEILSKDFRIIDHIKQLTS